MARDESDRQRGERLEGRREPSVALAASPRRRSPIRWRESISVGRDSAATRLWGWIAGRARHTVLGAFLTLLAFGTASASLPVADPSLLCEQAIRMASDREGVPLSVLSAIALNESGRRGSSGFRAWPWTVNMEGKGLWFDGPDEALAYARREFDRGARSFDVGCLQINYRWHGNNFSSIEQMFDPASNALYAARFLRSLYLEKGSWEAAAGAYHSLNPTFASPYAARFARLRADFLAKNGGEGPELPDLALASYGGGDGLAGAAAGLPAADWTTPAPRPPNKFPFFKAGGGAGIGSVVPLDNDEVVALVAPVQAGGGGLFAAPAARPLSDGTATEPGARGASNAADGSAGPETDVSASVSAGATGLGALSAVASGELPVAPASPSPLPDLVAP